MAKKDITRQISEEIGITQAEAKEIIQRTFDSISGEITDFEGL